MDVFHTPFLRYASTEACEVFFRRASRPRCGRSGNRTGIEQREIVGNPPSLGPNLLAAARDIQDELEEVPSGLLDGSLPGRDPACIEVDEVGPALGELSSGRNLDHRSRGEPIGCASPGRENLQGDARRELQCPAYEIA